MWSVHRASLGSGRRAERHWQTGRSNLPYSSAGVLVANTPFAHDWRIVLAAPGWALVANAAPIPTGRQARKSPGTGSDAPDTSSFGSIDAQGAVFSERAKERDAAIRAAGGARAIARAPKMRERHDA